MNALTEITEDLALYVVATPIGNLDDLSARATRILTTANLIAAEDTRHTRRLLSHIGSRARLISAHAHNERSSASQVIEALGNGQVCVLVSDAGTPAISDPGARLVYAVREAGYRVIPIPGASAPVTLLSVAGIDADRFGPAADRFLFAGFLPARTTGRFNALRELSTTAASIVLLESPNRIEALIESITQVFGDQRLLVLGRELTKKFEQIVSLPANDMLEWLSQDTNRHRGEFVVIIAPSPRREVNEPGDAVTAQTPLSIETSAGELMQSLGQFLAPAKAAKLARRMTGLPQDELYKLASQRDRNSDPADASGKRRKD